MSNYSDDDLDRLLAYGPSGSRGESRALAEDLSSARVALARAEARLALPEVVEALARHDIADKMSRAKDLTDAAERERNALALKE